MVSLIWWFSNVSYPVLNLKRLYNAEEAPIIRALNTMAFITCPTVIVSPDTAAPIAVCIPAKAGCINKDAATLSPITDSAPSIAPKIVSTATRFQLT